MSDPKPATPKAEALASKLKESLSKRRIKPWKAVLAALVASVVVLALLTYGFYPRPQPAPLQIMALDIVCTADETPQARAQLLTPPDDAAPRRLSGHTIVFHEPRLPLPGADQPREVVTSSDARGQAAIEWSV